MITIGRTQTGVYYDSVTLMHVSKKIAARAEVSEVAIMMATPANKTILTDAGLMVDELASAGDNDLLISIKASSRDSALQALEAVEQELRASSRKSRERDQIMPRSIEGAAEFAANARLAVISVAGRLAAAQARQALESGLNVLLFSDNVALADEIELKQFAKQKGLLLMGPDCGTAIIAGVPLGFANAVNRGHLGIVAASGTGAQEVSSIISNEGHGISHVLGTGGRDLSREVGGLTFIQAMTALARDEDTKLIILISKPPDAEVLEHIHQASTHIGKPVLSLFLGTDDWRSGMASTLEEVALMAIALAQGMNVDHVYERLEKRDLELRQIASEQLQRLSSRQRFIRGLFCGGTLGTEAQVILREMIAEIHSNIPIASAEKLANPLQSKGHTIIDLGDDELTAGRLHPMIDYDLRNRRILAEADDPQTAVILLDVVLGHGAHPDPATALQEVLRKAVKKTIVICSVTGTNRDPQNRARTVAALEQSGALVLPTNAAACRLAGFIAERL